MASKFLLTILSVAFLIPAQSFAVNLYKTETYREKDNCKVVKYLSEWKSMDQCLEEKQAYLERDAMELHSDLEGSVPENAQQVQQAQPDRWSIDPKDGKLKVNWIYSCLSLSLEEVKSKVTLCE